jgi:hypothetical protein
VSIPRKSSTRSLSIVEFMQPSTIHMPDLAKRGEVSVGDIPESESKLTIALGNLLVFFSNFRVLPLESGIVFRVFARHGAQTIALPCHRLRLHLCLLLGLLVVPFGNLVIAFELLLRKVELRKPIFGFYLWGLQANVEWGTDHQDTENDLSSTIDLLSLTSGPDIGNPGSIPISPETFAEGVASVTAHHAEEARRRDCVYHESSG